MTSLKNQFSDGSPIFTDNQHTIATMLKRWFKALPERLLANVEKGDESDEFALKYPTYLSPNSTTLMSWLLDLLLIVVEYKDENLMDPKNCGKFF